MSPHFTEGQCVNKKEAIELLDKLRDYVTAGESWHKKGYDFERRFSELCECRGLHCVKAPQRGHFDYVVNGARVQCKCLVPDARCFVYVQPGSGPAYSPDSFDVLAVETPKGLHLIPECLIPRTRSGLVRSHLHISFLERFTDAWWSIESGECPEAFERQLTLFVVEMEATDGR